MSTVPLHMQASGARALGQLVASLAPERREKACLEVPLTENLGLDMCINMDMCMCMCMYMYMSVVTCGPRSCAVRQLELVPWLCTLLTREAYSPECQKAAVQSLQLSTPAAIDRWRDLCRLAPSVLLTSARVSVLVSSSWVVRGRAARADGPLPR